jgi:ketosteroid isomerase-like protein
MMRVLNAALTVRSYVMPNPNQVAVEEHVHGDTVWIAVRARGADWSWLKPEEAVHLGRQWLERYDTVRSAAAE